MGFDDGGIILNREDETYYTGQVVKGRLEFDLSKYKTFRGIYVEFKGYCQVHWTTSHSRRQNDKTVHYTVQHNSYEEYVNVTTYLVGSKSGEHQLPPGSHAFPFEFQIPPHCPSSFEASDGHVRYEVKATVDRAFKFDQHKTARFRVLAPVDLNANPYCKEAFGIELFQSYCCWCMSAGKSTVTVKVPAGGACPRQLLPIELSCKNDSTVEIDAIRFQIVENKVFHAQSEPDTRSHHDTILEVKKGPIPGHTERNWVVELEIPDMTVPNLTACRFINIDYRFKVKVDTSGCHQDAEEERPFIIGTIPLGFNEIAPTVTPVSQGIAPYPTMNQPVGNPFYANTQNVPYPPAIGINPPPNHPASPYPNANPPYPNTSPYPAPYPTTNVGNAFPTSQGSPYPTPKVPYPVESNPPYPPTSSPYPPTSSPYPPTSSPYPPTSSPYPPTSSPYPPSSVPVGSSPKSALTGTTLLKTGNFGFIHGNKGDTATLLPPSSVPYAASPYASASAPEPSTPGDDGNKDSDDMPTYSTPFNPAYKDKPEHTSIP